MKFNNFLVFFIIIFIIVIIFTFYYFLDDLWEIKRILMPTYKKTLNLETRLIEIEKKIKNVATMSDRKSSPFSITYHSNIPALDHYIERAFSPKKDAQKDIKNSENLSELIKYANMPSNSP
jgi:hypothetical protein